MVILSQAPSRGKVQRLSRHGSRPQVGSKRRASQADDDIVCPMMKVMEHVWKRHVRNTRDKHSVSSSHWDDQNGWNESSRRYITENEEFYVPDSFMSAPDNKKQGAAGPIDSGTNMAFRAMLVREQLHSLNNYELALEAGIAPEQARLFLPAYGMYVRWRWTGSLNSIMNFLQLRLDGHAQSEIQSYAAAVEQIVAPIYPVTYAAWKEHR